jgi:hypothetical protein
MADFIHICVLAESPDKPLAVTSAEVGKQMFIKSSYGPDVKFVKEVGLGFWSVWKDNKKIGWINLSRIVDEKFAGIES